MPEELSVAEGEASRSVHPDLILVELLDFHDGTSSVPFGGVVAGLILDTYPVTDLEWGEGSGMFGPAVLREAVALTKCRLSETGCLARSGEGGICQGVSGSGPWWGGRISMTREIAWWQDLVSFDIAIWHAERSQC